MERAVFQALFAYLDPIAQWRIRSVCRDFYNWSKDWPTKLWNIMVLLDKEKRKKLPWSITPDILNRDHPFSAQRALYLEIRHGYVKIQVFASPMKYNFISYIVVSYYRNGNFETNQRDAVQHRWLSWGNGCCRINGRFRKVRGLPFSNIYKIYRTIVTEWHGSRKARRMLR